MKIPKDYCKEECLLGEINLPTFYKGPIVRSIAITKATMRNSINNCHHPRPRPPPSMRTTNLFNFSTRITRCRLFFKHLSRSYWTVNLSHDSPKSIHSKDPSISQYFTIFSFLPSPRPTHKDMVASRGKVKRTMDFFHGR